jgi:hypothetical protein
MGQDGYVWRGSESHGTNAAHLRELDIPQHHAPEGNHDDGGRESPRASETRNDLNDFEGDMVTFAVHCLNVVDPPGGL